MIPLLSVSENSGTIGFSGLAGQVFSGCRNAFPASAAGKPLIILWRRYDTDQQTIIQREY
jgi:hypothetical protein